ncbi:MAG: alternative ribosome rescue aminoacyl-tRNA hydrolase ArfB [Gammaproteobacteria bacterium]
MISITNNIRIDEKELRFRFVRAAGPGGQNVNKVATAVQLWFDVIRSPLLPDPVRERLLRLAGKRVSRGGVLTIEARRYRTQERNRQDAIERFIRWLQRAAEHPKPRRKTIPSPAAKARRLDEKRHRSGTKHGRAKARLIDEVT